MLAGSLTGTTTTSSLPGLASLQSLGNNNISAHNLQNAVNGLGSTNHSGMDTLSQAYTGIQQYAGLSCLVSQGKGSLIFPSFSGVTAIVVLLNFK